MEAPELPDFDAEDELPAGILMESLLDDFSLPDERALIAWVTAALAEEQQPLQYIQYLFCDDAYLLQLNVQFLQHTTLTDIITFPYHAEGDPIESEIYISVERVRENATTFGVSPEEELRRVIIHGALHLCGYKDKTPAQKKAMRAREDYYLQRF